MENRFEEFNSEQKEQFNKLIEMEKSDCDLGEMINACFNSDPEVAHVFSDILLETIDRKIEELTAAEESEDIFSKCDQDENLPDDTFDKIVECIHEADWNASMIDEEKHVILIRFKTLSTVLSVYVTVNLKYKSIHFHVPYSFKCKKTHYIFLADEITHINSGMRFGAFQLNYDNGTISYNYAYNYDQEHFSESIFRECMEMSIMSGDIFFSGLRSLAEENIPLERIKSLHENLMDVLDEQK